MGLPLFGNEGFQNPSESSENILAILDYTTLTNLSMIYLVMCKVYTDVGGIKKLYIVCPPVRKIIHSLKLVDYLHVQADNPWYKGMFKNNSQSVTLGVKNETVVIGEIVIPNKLGVLKVFKIV